MTTDDSFELRPNCIAQINMVSLGMNTHLFMIIG